MRAAQQILLVEGESDRAFLEVMCRSLTLDTHVRVALPRDLAGQQVVRNTKEGVFNLLPTLLQQLSDGSLQRLAVMVDADTPPNGGFEPTRERVSSLVAPHGYTTSSQPADLQNSGLIYAHDDGLADFGLWVMPDNASDGMLEDWVKQCIHGNELALFNHAKTVIANLPSPPKFSQLHLSKAEISTWLAWQKRPGHGLYRALEDGLIDNQHPCFAGLTGWLKSVFQPADIKE